MRPAKWVEILGISEAAVRRREPVRLLERAKGKDSRNFEQPNLKAQVSKLWHNCERLDRGWQPFSQFEVMDGESTELGKYHSAFFKSDDCDYKDKIRQQFVDIFGLDLLIIHYVEIHEAFRQHGFGLLAVSRTIDIFGENCGLVAMKPFPLQFTNYLDPGWRPPDNIEDPTRAFRAATEKLRSHWARVGFKRVNGTDYCALSPARKRPSLRTIAAAVRRTGGPGWQQVSLLSGFPVESEACSRRLLEERPRMPYK